MNRRHAIALAAAALAACSTRDRKVPPIGTIDLDGVKRRLADAKSAGKVAVLHFWATWCGPCIDEFPALARMYDRIVGEPRIDFVAIAVAEEDPVAVKRFVDESRATFPVMIAVTDDAEEFTDSIDPRWGGVLPTTLVFAPDGTLVIRHLGAVEDTRDFEARLRELVKG